MTSIQQTPASCSFVNIQFPENLVVIAGGAYSGRKTGRQIDESGHEATVMDVVVNVPDKPVALLLGSHEPTIWKIVHTPQTRIAAIVLSGYYTQVLNGISSEIPLLNSTYVNQGPCGHFYLADDGMNKLEPLAQRLFQRSLQNKFFAVEGRLMIGRPVGSEVSLLTDNSTPMESFFTKLAPPAGVVGIREALEQGVLRQATLGDAVAFARAFQRHRELEFGAEPIPIAATDGKESDLLENAYVVLNPFVLPSGLYGSAAATFFVPLGVPRPTGKPGHAQINAYDQLRQ